MKLFLLTIAMLAAAVAAPLVLSSGWDWIVVVLVIIGFLAALGQSIRQRLDGILISDLDCARALRTGPWPSEGSARALRIRSG